MSTLRLTEDKCHQSIGTLDIETSGLDGATDHLIAVGAGHYEADGDDVEVAVHTQQDYDGDEQALIRDAYEWLNQRDPAGLVTFNGSEFDFEFLDDKSRVLGVDGPQLACRQNHLDLFVLRRRQANAQGRKWPSLEESLAAYGIPEYETTWEGTKLDNERFGEELAPRYVSALRNSDEELNALESVVRDYTETDIEANIALYEHDAGRTYIPSYVP